jgi:hypothetical protein
MFNLSHHVTVFPKKWAVERAVVRVSGRQHVPTLSFSPHPACGHLPPQPGFFDIETHIAGEGR